MIKFLPYLVVLVPIVVTLLGIILINTIASFKTRAAENRETPRPLDSNQEETFESEEPINPKSRKIRWE